MKMRTVIIALAGLAILIGAAVFGLQILSFYNTPPARTGTPAITRSFSDIATRVKSPTPSSGANLHLIDYKNPVKRAPSAQSKLYTSCIEARSATATPTFSGPTPAVTPPSTALPLAETPIPTPTISADPDYVVLQVIGAESEACYQVGEVFVDENFRYEMAVGVTKAINGEIAIDRANLANSLIGQIVIDISQLRSGEQGRDGAIRERGLESNKYPLATLTDAQIIGLPAAAYEDGQTYKFRIVGTLEIRAVKQQVTFDAIATLTGDTLVATAFTDLKMTDFGFSPLSIAGGVIRVNDDFRIILNLVAREPKDTAVQATTQPTAVSATETVCVPTKGGRITTKPADEYPERNLVGKGYILRGVVRSMESCTPLANVKLIFWMTNEDGEYDGTQTGILYTDENGEYMIESAFPGGYGNARPHIHMIILADGHFGIETEFFPRRDKTEQKFEIVLIKMPA